MVRLLFIILIILSSCQKNDYVNNIDRLNILNDKNILDVFGFRYLKNNNIVYYQSPKNFKYYSVFEYDVSTKKSKLIFSSKTCNNKPISSNYDLSVYDFFVFNDGLFVIDLCTDDKNSLSYKRCYKISNGNIKEIVCSINKSKSIQSIADRNYFIESTSDSYTIYQFPNSILNGKYKTIEIPDTSYDFNAAFGRSNDEILVNYCDKSHNYNFIFYNYKTKKQTNKYIIPANMFAGEKSAVSQLFYIPRNNTIMFITWKNLWFYNLTRKELRKYDLYKIFSEHDEESEIFIDDISFDTKKILLCCYCHSGISVFNVDIDYIINSSERI